MPCEVTIFIHKKGTICPHPSITNCIDCRVNLCSAHISECDVCELFLCPDCIVEHKREHELTEQRLRARA